MARGREPPEKEKGVHLLEQTHAESGNSHNIKLFPVLLYHKQGRNTTERNEK